jgi:hypothetical protein
MRPLYDHFNPMEPLSLAQGYGRYSVEEGSHIAICKEASFLHEIEVSSDLQNHIYEAVSVNAHHQKICTVAIAARPSPFPGVIYFVN